MASSEKMAEIADHWFVYGDGLVEVVLLPNRFVQAKVEVGGVAVRRGQLITLSFLGATVTILANQVRVEPGRDGNTVISGFIAGEEE